MQRSCFPCTDGGLGNTIYTTCLHPKMTEKADEQHFFLNTKNHKLKMSQTRTKRINEREGITTGLKKNKNNKKNIPNLHTQNQTEWIMLVRVIASQAKGTCDLNSKSEIIKYSALQGICTDITHRSACIWCKTHIPFHKQYSWFWQ